jgi:hypothetical protein
VGGGGGVGGAHLAGDGEDAPISLSKSCPAGSEITITGDRAADLPAAGTLITPAYADGAARIVPRITSVGAGRLLTTVNGSNHASGFKLVGIELFCSGIAPNVNNYTATTPCIGVGATSNGTLDPSINTISDLPSNIVFDRVIIRADPTLNSAAQIVVFDPNGGTFANSWVSGGTNHSSDSQGIWMMSGQNVTIRNNYVSGLTESLALQGACSPIHDFKGIGPPQGECTTSTYTMVPTNVLIEHNEVTHEPWQQNLRWTPSTYVPKGQLGQTSSGAASSADCRFQALNAGTTGTVEPNWSSIPNLLETLADGSVTWQNMGSCGGTKNLFESKGSNNVVLRHNTLHTVYQAPYAPYGGQGYAITLTSRTTGGSGGGNASSLTNTTVENNVVRDAALALNTASFDNADQNIYPTLWPANAPPYNIAAANNTLALETDNGSCTIALTTGPARTAAQIQADINASACNTRVWSCLIADRFVIRASADGANTCLTAAYAPAATYASIQANPVSNSAAATLGIAESVTHYSCEQPRTGVWYGCGMIDGLFVVNNLFTGLNKSADHGTDRLYVVSLFGRPAHVRFRNNTLEVDPTNHGRGYPLYFFLMEPSGSHAPFDVQITDNILGYTQDRSHYVATNTVSLNTAPPNGATIHDLSAINQAFCQPMVSTRTNIPIDSWCPSTIGIFSHNLMPGAPLYSGTALDTRPANSNAGFLKYPNNNWNDTWSSIRFRDSNLGLKVYSSYPTLHNFLRSGSDGRQVGVDTTQLPLIENLTITPSDRAAIARLSLTAPAGEYTCVARLSADPTLLSSINPVTVPLDLDPSRYARPDSSDADWLPKSGRRRWFVFGHNAALASSTTYYYHFNCGGAVATGSFRTLGPLEGTSDIAFTRTPTAAMGPVANCTVEYGAGYSRSSGAIAGAAVSGSCTAGSVYSVTVSGLPKGTPVYARVRYRDALGADLWTEEATVFMPL